MQQKAYEFGLSEWKVEYASKWLENITKDHIAMHTVLLSLVPQWYNCFLNNIMYITNKLKLLICSPQGSASFKHFNTLTTSTYTTTTFITEAFHLITCI